MTDDDSEMRKQLDGALDQSFKKNSEPRFAALEHRLHKVEQGVEEIKKNVIDMQSKLDLIIKRLP